MRLFVWIIGVVMMITGVVANTKTIIEDVSAEDPNRKAINYAVDRGFLNLFQDNKFRS